MVEDSHCLSVLRSHTSEGRLTRSFKIPTCIGCGQEIFDQYILRVSPDLEWHASCLKCVDCQQYLDESCTCYVRDGKTYCKRDYDRLFSTKCAKCQGPFAKNAYVMRARNRVFHLECFRCIACSQLLQTGEEFAMRDDGGLFCKRDHELLEKGLLRNSHDEMQQLCTRDDCTNNHSPCSSGDQTLTPLTPPPSGLMFGTGSAGSSTPPAILSANNENAQAGSHHRSYLQFRSPSPASMMNEKIIISSGKKKDGQKTTRVRTVLNEKQLHTLRTCYSANPRPDALMKEQLVEMTGLSPRVIRVWFQNKRCKDKKRQLMIKQIQQQQEKTQALNGIRLHQTVGPLIAASPVRQDLAGIMQPMEITQYASGQHLNAASCWNKLDYLGSPLQHAGGGLVDPTIDSPMHQVPPFQQLLHGFGDPSVDPTAPLGFLAQALTQSHSGETINANGGSSSSISPVLVTSDLSSPSCSD